MLNFLASVLCGLCLAAGVLLAVTAPFSTASSSRRGRGLRRAGASRWLRSGLPALAAGAAVAWVTGWPVAAPIVAGGVLGLPPVLAPPGSRRALALQDALATWTRRLADLLSAGAGGLEHALVRSAHTAPEPLTGPVARLVERMRHQGTEPALRAFAGELADPAVDEIVLALLLRTRAGGRGLADVLTAHAHALSAEATSRRGIEADRATSRTTVRCLVGISLVLLAGLVLVAGDYLAPLASMTGQGVLALAALIAAGSLAWMRHLTTSTPPARYLPPSTPDTIPEGAR